MRNSKFFGRVFFASLATLIVWWQPAQAAVLPAQAEVLDVNEYDGYVEYLGLTGGMGPGGRNAPFRMLVPDNWNEQLIVYARGTGSATKLNVVVDENGQTTIEPQVDDSNELGLPLPIVGVTPLINVPGKLPGDNTANDNLEACWLGLKDCSMDPPGLLETPESGYALVASDYKPDLRFLTGGKLGWVVEDGIQDTLAVTQQAKGILANHYKEQQLDRTLLIGRSQGSVIALKIEDTIAGLYDGVITGCTVGAGTPRVWDNGVGLALAFDAAFGWECNAATEEACMQDDGNGGRKKIDWGSPEGGDIPVDISFQEDVLPTLINHLSNGDNFGLFEFIRLVNGLPFEGFYPPADPSNPVPGGLEFNWLLADMLFLTEVRADLEGPLKANGRVAQNTGHRYTLSSEEIKYLKGLGVKIGPLLSVINSTRFKADPQAREYVKDYADFSGNLSRPVISMHTWSRWVGDTGERKRLCRNGCGCREVR